MNVPGKYTAATAPLVSVAIITFNQKDFLVECIESILGQDYPNLEIVVADDGSTDGTHEVMYEYDRRYPGRFKLALSSSNRGITNNSNAALFACAGKYVAWMGGDDLMLPGKISAQVQHMESHPDCTICYHDLDVFDSSTDRTLYLFSKRSPPKQGGVEVLIVNQVFNGACSCMVRSDKSPVHGFNTLLPYASDWLYWIEALHQGGTIDYIDRVLGRYRRHGGNITGASPRVGQNDLDHLNTCSFLLALDPRYFTLAMRGYSSRLLNMRKKVPYLPAVWTSLKLDLTAKGLACLAAYCLSLGRVTL